MFWLPLYKIENIYQLAEKLYRHCNENENDLFRNLITENATADIDSGVISSKKFSLRLDNSVPRHLYFNHIFFLSVLLVETSDCSCSNVCNFCSFNKLFKSSVLSQAAPWCGIIGPGLTIQTHSLLSPLSSILKLHAVFHDAYGHLYRVYKKGPGYTYALPLSFVPSFFWLGHVTGFIFFLCLKFRHSSAFRRFESHLN